MPDTPGLWGDLREDIDITLPFCLYIPGCMHILGNASQEALTAAVGFDEVLVGLRAICHFMSDKTTRNLYCATCLIGAAQALSTLFDGFSESLVDWRWASIWSCVKKLVELEDALRSTWDKDKIVGRTAGAKVADPVQREGVDQGFGAHLGDAKEAIKSAYFWSYVKMLFIVGVVAEHLFAWVESCPCHGSLQLGALNWSTARREFARMHAEFREIHTCPLRGRRGPELARGSCIPSRRRYCGSPQRTSSSEPPAASRRSRGHGCWATSTPSSSLWPSACS